MKNKKKKIKSTDAAYRSLVSKNPKRKSMILEKAKRIGNFKSKKSEK